MIGVDHLAVTGAYFNLPAVLLIGAVSTVLIVGVHLSANFNNLMVAIKLAIVLVVIGVCLPLVVPANHVPFIPPEHRNFRPIRLDRRIPRDWRDFFAYIGFDAVSVAAQEARNPQRDVPIGILGSLVLCTILYMLMSYVVTGIAPYSTLNVAHPVRQAVEALPGKAWLAMFVNIGAVVGLASVVLVLLLGQSRIFYAMATDGLVLQGILPSFTHASARRRARRRS